MTPEDTRKRYASGREQWNQWANECLTTKEKMKDQGKLAQWEKDVRVAFQDSSFERKMDFSRFIFPGPTDFRGVTFQRLADFDNAQFHGNVSFERASFRRLASFRDAQFLDKVSFRAIQAAGSFNMVGAKFERIPDFIQANFLEAPSLDGIQVPSATTRRPTNLSSQDAALYRALKRLAIQGHDHVRELQFFADELRSERSPSLVRRLLVTLYELLSDFGRSVLRSVLWWVGTTVFFGGAYFTRHSVLEAPSCIAGTGSPLHSAIYLAVRKGLIFPGLSQDQKLDQAYACLYGTTKLGDHREIPIIPESIAYLGIAQTLISAVLIFLFLLAIRNHFRIR